MPYEKNLFATAEERNNLSGEYIYGSFVRELVFLNGEHDYRRFAPLARKALRHYAKDAYNPHKVEFVPERWVRAHICNFIEIKVRNKIQYDWELIDNYLKKVIGRLMKIDIPYDATRLEYAIPEAQVPDITEEK